MKRSLYHLSEKIISGLALAFGGLLLMSITTPAHADGYFMFAGADLNTPNPVNYFAGSSARVSPGQTSSASSYSNYSAQPGESGTAGDAHGNITVTFFWVNQDGQTPSARGNYDDTHTSHIDGGTTPSGATAASSTDQLSASAPSPTSYSLPINGVPGPVVYTQDLTGKKVFLDDQINVHATTTASPDNSSDPQNENYGNPTAAAAGASVNVTLNPTFS